MSNSYDIIKDRVVISAPNGAKLPISIDKTYVIEYESLERKYTDAELVILASGRLRAKTASFLAAADLLNIKTSGKFEKNGYIICSELVFLCDVGVSREFVIE